MDTNNVEKILPAEVAGGAGEKNSAADGGVTEETTAPNVVVADEQEVTMALTVVADEQQQEVTVALDITAGGNDGGESSAKKQPKREAPELMTEFSPPTQKRVRGRPKGSGKLQRLQAAVASSGDEYIGDSSGSNFTPHLLRVQKGENIVERIRAFFKATRDSVCIISACGSVSIADVYTSLPRHGILRYEGDFNIVTLNGSHTYTNKRGAKICAMSVQLANPDGRLCGGVVANSLIASTPAQIMMGTFKQNMKKVGPKYKGDVTVAAIGGSPVQQGEGMRLLAVAERVNGVNSDKYALAQPISTFNPSASPL